MKLKQILREIFEENKEINEQLLNGSDILDSFNEPKMAQQILDNSELGPKSVVEKYKEIKVEFDQGLKTAQESKMAVQKIVKDAWSRRGKNKDNSVVALCVSCNKRPVGVIIRDFSMYAFAGSRFGRSWREFTHVADAAEDLNARTVEIFQVFRDKERSKS